MLWATTDMRVSFTPPLREQIARTLRPVAAKPVVIRSAGHLVMRIDPISREATTEPQQFIAAPDGALKILPLCDWIQHPDEIVVAGVEYR